MHPRRLLPTVLTALAIVAALGVSTASQATAGGAAQLCGYAVLSEVHLDDDGSVVLSAAPQALRISGGRLWAGDRDELLAAGERQRLDAYALRMRRVIPALSQAARSGLRLGVDAALLALQAQAGSPLQLPEAERERLRRLHDELAGHWPPDRLPAQALGNGQLDADLDALGALLAELGQLSPPLRVPSPLAAPVAHAHRTAAGVTGLSHQLERLCADIAVLDLLENSIGRFEVFRDGLAPSV